MITWENMIEMQPKVSSMLMNSMKKGRMVHAYLFEGEKGTGKKEMALLMAKCFLCEGLQEGYKPCGVCRNCKRIDSGNHPDVHMIEPDGLSIKKEQIKNLQTEFSKKSVEGDSKIYIVGSAEKMSVQAANSLLKFLEEPAPGTRALLLTEQAPRILPTILSRCQEFSFQPLSRDRMREKLKEEGVPVQEASIISHITHNFEEGLSLSSDEWFAQAQKKVVKLYEVLQTNPLKALLYLQEDWFAHFKEREQLERGLDLLFLIYKDLLYIQLDQRNLVVFQSLGKELESHALHLSQKRLGDQMGAVLEAKRKLLSNTNPQLLMEQLVLNLQEGSSFV